MPILKVILAISMCVLFYTAGYYSAPVKIVVDDAYKKAFLDLVEKIDSSHVHCFTIGN